MRSKTGPEIHPKAAEILGGCASSGSGDGAESTGRQPALPVVVSASQPRPSPPPEVPPNGQVDSEVMTRTAIGMAGEQGRTNVYSQSEAESTLQAYSWRIPETNKKGQREAYTEADAGASVQQAYYSPAREPPATPSKTEPPRTGPDQKDRAPKPATAHKESQATRVLSIVQPRMELFHCPSSRGYASFTVHSHVETYPIKSRNVRLYLQHAYFECEAKSLSSQALQEALGVLEGEALFNGAEHSVHTRVAGHNGNIYLDLTDREWRAVEITPTGWSIVNDPPVKFRRAAGALSIPAPVTDKDARSKMRILMNVSENDFALLLSWLVGALSPKGPYPILDLQAEHGAGKSMTTRMLRKLIDPHKSLLRSQPKEIRDLMIAATNSWLICLDNMSHIEGWLSDALCRLATGGGFGTRELFSDDDEIILDAQRPVILNGIESLCVRADLMDRALIVELPAIEKSMRQTEQELWSAFSKQQPGMLAYLLDAVVAALANVQNVSAELPRMADFALWATAAEQALGLKEGDFLRLYEENRREATALVLENSTIGRLLLNHPAPWDGTASELLTVFGLRATSAEQRSRAWPKTPHCLSNAIRRLVPALRTASIIVEFTTEGHDKRRVISIRSDPMSETKC